MSLTVDTDHVQVNWEIPTGITVAAGYDKVDIYRSTNEDQGYQLLATITFTDATTYYVDVAADASERDSYYYLTKFRDDSDPTKTTGYFPTYRSLTPREFRLVRNLRTMEGCFVTQVLTDTDLLIGLQHAVQSFNIVNPITAFTISTFPQRFEILLLQGAIVYGLLYHYLRVAITDFNYSEGGISLNIDRGAKIKTATDALLSEYTKLVNLAKWEFLSPGAMLGTVPLPVSIGGNLNRGLMNVLDVFTSLGK